MTTEIELDVPYLFKDIFPEIYRDMYFRAYQLLNRNKDKIENRLGNLKVIFIGEDISKSGYEPTQHSVNFRLPSYVLKIIRQRKDIGSDYFLFNLQDIKNFVSSDALSVETIVHEVMHGLQNLKDDKKIDMYDRSYDETILHGGDHPDVPFEKGSIVESLFYAKKKGLTLKDYNRSYVYHFWNKLKESMGIFDKMEDLQKKYILLRYTKDVDIREQMLGLKEDVKNIIGVKLGKHYDTFEMAMHGLNEYFYSMDNDNLLYLMLNDTLPYWKGENDEDLDVGYKRHEVSKDIWAKLVWGMIKIAYQLEDVGLYKEAFMIDKLIKEV